MECILCEQTGRWAAILRPLTAGSRVRWREVRTPDECLDSLRLEPGSFLVLELAAARLDAGLELLAAVQTDFPRAKVAVVAGRDLAEYEWLVREMGAVAFETSPRRVAPLAAAARRHAEANQSGERPLAERIWAELPWG